MKTILVAGGAGYIGSHMVATLAESGYQVLTLDNLCSGHRDAVIAGEFIAGDLADVPLLDNVFVRHRFDCVMHFSAHLDVGESVRDPSKYYRNNVANTQKLLDAMIKHGVRAFIFSSSAAIFGEPRYVPIDELHPQVPVNPYGRSKWMVEQMLEDYDRAYGLKSVALRYFNAAGADPKGRLGERHDPETHLIPLLLQVASGKRERITVFGSDYDTPDGTCIRDYVHVSDLCEAHRLALHWLLGGGQSRRYNLGNGDGYSVLQVIDAVKKITGKSVSFACGDRREGDPTRLVADSTRAQTELGWQPRYPDLETIIEHAWRWESNRTQV